MGPRFPLGHRGSLITTCYKTASSLSNFIVGVVIKGNFCSAELLGICIVVVDTGIYTSDTTSQN